jgi:hypothetical protein
MLGSIVPCNRALQLFASLKYRVMTAYGVNPFSQHLTTVLFVSDITSPDIPVCPVPSCPVLSRLVLSRRVEQFSYSSTIRRML